MNKTKKLQDYMVKYLEKQIQRIKSINRPSQISHIIDDIDMDILETYETYCRSITKGQYFEKDKDFDNFFES